MIWQLNKKLGNKEISAVICAYKTPSIFPAVLSTMNSYQTMPSILQVCIKRTIFIAIIIGSKIFVGLKKNGLLLLRAFISSAEVCGIIYFFITPQGSDRNHVTLDFWNHWTPVTLLWRFSQKIERDPPSLWLTNVLFMLQIYLVSFYTIYV